VLHFQSHSSLMTRAASRFSDGDARTLTFNMRANCHCRRGGAIRSASGLINPLGEAAADRFGDERPELGLRQLRQARLLAAKLGLAAP